MDDPELPVEEGGHVGSRAAFLNERYATPYRIVINAPESGSEWQSARRFGQRLRASDASVGYFAYDARNARFDLTLTEAAKLSTCRAVPGTAAALAIKTSTVRSHLKSIFTAHYDLAL
jgi:hypothetical protein